MSLYTSSLQADQTAWRKDSACAEATEEQAILGDAWINEHSPVVYAAKQICGGCTVRLECVLDAVLDPASEGMRAGVFFHGGSVSRKDAAALKQEFGFSRVKISRMSKSERY